MKKYWLKSITFFYSEFYILCSLAKFLFWISLWRQILSISLNFSWKHISRLFSVIVSPDIFNNNDSWLKIFILILNTRTIRWNWNVTWMDLQCHHPFTRRSRRSYIRYLNSMECDKSDIETPNCFCSRAYTYKLECCTYERNSHKLCSQLCM